MRQKTISRLAGLGLLAALAGALLSGTAALGAQSALSDRVVRLHVLANSNSREDQDLKLHVRDRVLERATALLAESARRADAERVLSAALPELEALAAAEIAARGYDYPVSARLEETAFPTKTYDGFALPAGEYLALRVVIGEGGGRNWWCVVFPPLCTTAAADVPAAALAAGLTAEQVDLITEKDEEWQLKFKTVELWDRLRRALAGERKNFA